MYRCWKNIVRTSFIEDDLNVRFSIEYKIHCDSGGVQVPLVFFASDGEPEPSFPADFRVWLNNKEVTLLAGSGWEKGKHRGLLPMFDEYSDRNDGLAADNESSVFRTQMSILPDWGFELFVRLKDLRYFEANLPAGKHVVRIEYSANPWKQLNGYVADLEYLYSFVPAMNWDSGASHKIILDRQALGGHLTTSLGHPHSGDSLSVANWEFQAIPGSVFSVNVRPEVSWLARRLTAIGPIRVFPDICRGICLYTSRGITEIPSDWSAKWISRNFNRKRAAL